MKKEYIGLLLGLVFMLSGWGIWKLGYMYVTVSEVSVLEILGIILIVKNLKSITSGRIHEEGVMERIELVSIEELRKIKNRGTIYLLIAFIVAVFAWVMVPFWLCREPDSCGMLGTFIYLIFLSPFVFIFLILGAIELEKFSKKKKALFKVPQNGVNNKSFK